MQFNRSDSSKKVLNHHQSEIKIDFANENDTKAFKIQVLPFHGNNNPHLII